jgi:phage terminase large subunit-like protein
VRAFLDEAEMFPNGPTKDQIDAASMAFAKLLVAPGSQHIGW